MAGVTRWWVGWDSAWEQKKPKARKIPVASCQIPYPK